MDQKTEKDKTERITGLGRRTREDIAKRNKMTALRFQTGGRHQTSPASRPHKSHMIMTSQPWSKCHRPRPCFRNFQTSILNKMINQLKKCCKCFFFLLYISVYFISVDKMRDDSSSLCPIELPFRSSTVDNYRFFVRHAMTKQSESLAVLCTSWYVQRASVLRSWFVQQVDH